MAPAGSRLLSAKVTPASRPRGQGDLLLRTGKAELDHRPGARDQVGLTVRKEDQHPAIHQLAVASELRGSVESITQVPPARRIWQGGRHRSGASCKGPAKG